MFFYIFTSISMNERWLEHREKEEKKWIEYYESIFWTETFYQEIEKLSYQEKEKLLACIDYLLREWDPSRKSLLKQMRQIIFGSIWTPPGFTPSFRNILKESYTIDWHSFAVKIHGIWSDTSKLRGIGINPNTFTQKNVYWIKCSKGWHLAPTAWTNLRLFVLWNGKEPDKKIIYIGDRYVIQQERGQWLGKTLLKLIDTIAKDIWCTTIFGSLVPEEWENLEKLKQWHKNFWYRIEDHDGTQIAIKDIE